MAVLVISDAKSYLNITATTYDVELQEFIDAAESAIARRCGPLSAVSVSARVVGGGDTLLLPKSPAVSLTSVAPVGGSPMNLPDLYLDPAGVVEWDVGAGSFSAARYDVTYTAGRASVDPDLMQGIKETVKHLWETQRGGSRRPGMSDDVLVGAAYAFTYRILELLAPHMQPGMA